MARLQFCMSIPLQPEWMGEMRQILGPTVLKTLRRALISIGLTSAVINLLALTGSFFMLQVYDRVIPGHSLPTLFGLMVIAGSLFAFQAVLEVIRSMLLVRIGTSVDEQLASSVVASLVDGPAQSASGKDMMLPLRDVDTVRNFLGSLGPIAFFDLPWMPVYVAICFLFHYWIGIAALAGALVLAAITVFADVLTRKPLKRSAHLSSERHAFAEAVGRNWESVRAMGFEERVASRWGAVNAAFLAGQRRASDITTTLSTVSKIFRIALQSAVLAVGAILVIRQEATAGIMIASSILVSRALAPVELAIGNWKSFLSMRQSLARLKALPAWRSDVGKTVILPRANSNMRAEGLLITAPGTRDVLVKNISFDVSAGTVLGVIGPSASGKSTLARALAGAWPIAAGSIRLDGASIDQFGHAQLGANVGYVSQDVCLFDGSIAENISRFGGHLCSDAVIAAAKAAGAYDMIVKMPGGFDAKVGNSGDRLSGGQRQRIALARALFGDPFLVVLDEPNAHLDAEGDAALALALSRIKERGGIAIVVAHKPSLLASVDRLIVMNGGQIVAMGPTEEVMKRTVALRATSSPLRLVPSEEVE
jgi:ATP-binding cassette, subfamily C, bacterial PrsD